MTGWIDTEFRILFLGTGSGDFYLTRNKNSHRYPSQLLLPNGCLIDFSSEGIQMLRTNAVAFDSIVDVFITHSQLDHFHAPTIVRFALERKKKSQTPLNVWGTEIIGYILEQEILLSDTSDLFKINTIEPFGEYDLGHARILSVPANHLKHGPFKRLGETALNFIITVASKTVLYAVDTGEPEESTMAFWKKHRFEAIIMEATLGDSPAEPSLGHLNFVQAAGIIEYLRENGIFTRNGQAILTHLNPSCPALEEETSRKLEEQGILLASDGMWITV